MRFYRRSLMLFICSQFIGNRRLITRIQQQQAHNEVLHPVNLAHLRPVFLEVTVGILKDDPKLRKVYMSYHNDGVLDVFIGWCIFLAGLMLFTEMVWMVGVYAAIMAPMRKEALIRAPVLCV